MARKKRTPEESSIDPAAQQMLIRADEMGISTAFSRADAMAPCNIGSAGMCCKLCGMGPCRLTKDGQTGVCGATIDTIQARNLIRAIAAGAAAHSDHGRDMAFTLKAVANGEAEGYVIRDVAKLRVVASNMISRSKVGPRRRLRMTWLISILPSSASKKAGVVTDRQSACQERPRCGRKKEWSHAGSIGRWSKRCTAPILVTIRISPTSLHHAVRTSLADGWGGSLMATDISDILFGTPAPILGQANLGVLKDDMVNVVVHGHEPTLSQMIVAASQTPEIIEYAKAAGAKGINLSGICCTANEILDAPGYPGGRELPPAGARHPDRRG